MFELLKRFRRHKPVNESETATLMHVPKHVAVIMDGNGRWANAQGMTRIAGHKKGGDAVKRLIRGCIDHGVSHLTIFAFSSENWNRPRREVDALMELFGNALDTQQARLSDNDIKLQFIGDLGQFSSTIQAKAAEAERVTADNKSLVFTVAINYGGRWDITQACQKIAQQVAAGNLQVNAIDEQTLADHLSTAGLPDPDLFIRTSGEYRISNFLLWQSAYSEFYFTDLLWPDFDEQALTRALEDYARRERRFGGARDKISQLNATASGRTANVRKRA